MSEPNKSCLLETFFWAKQIVLDCLCVVDLLLAQSGSGQEPGEFGCAKQIAVGFSDFTKEDGECEASARLGQRAGVRQGVMRM